MADITFINLNMLFVRYSDSYDKDLHLPLGLLYLTSVLEEAGYEVQAIDEDPEVERLEELED